MLNPSSLNQDQPGPIPMTADSPPFDPMPRDKQFALSMKYSNYVLIILPFRLSGKTLLGLFDAQRNLIEILDSTPNLDTLYAVSQQAEKVVTEKCYQLTKFHNERVEQNKLNPIKFVKTVSQPNPNLSPPTPISIDDL